jgi:hypothetical protein
MRHLLFLSSISALAASGCSDDCGPGDAPEFGLVASSAEVTLTYGDLSAGANNDCPDADAPKGVVSLTLEGMQQNATSTTSFVTFCIPRPDQLPDGVPIGTGFRIIDFRGDKDGCTFEFGGGVPTGIARATGLCDHGQNKAGFALTVDGNLLLRRTCPTATDTIAVALSGTVAVAAR